VHLVGGDARWRWDEGTEAIVECSASASRQSVDR